jgi:probable HAF family extracellular repeat protein
MLRQCVMAVLVFSLVVFAGTASAVVYNFTDIGTYSGSTIPIPFGDLADARNVNGGLNLVSANFVWQGANPQNSSGTSTVVNPSWGQGAVKLNAISTNGQTVVGRCYSNGNQVTPIEYNVGDPGTTATDLSPYTGYGPSATGFGRGLIALSNCAYVPTPANTAIALPASTGAGNGPYHEMSSNGNIVGANGVAMLWTPIISVGQITGYNNPVTLGDGSNGNPYGVNDAGQAVGSYYFMGNMVPTTGPALLTAGHAYLLDPSGDPTLAGGNALGINSNGTVVGMSNFAGAYGSGVSTAHAFIWTPNAANGTTGTMEDLNVKFASLKPANYTFTCAVDINDNGDILGVMYYGATKHLFLISSVPTPEPSTIALIASGLVGLLAYAWRKRR